MSANDVTTGRERSPEAVGFQGFQQIGKWPDVDPVRAAHASLTRTGQNPAAQARERGDGAESGQVAIDERGVVSSRGRYAVMAMPVGVMPVCSPAAPAACGPGDVVAKLLWSSSFCVAF